MWPLDPKPEDIHIEDIAHGLSNTCRYSGQVLGYYSVAQHCVHVSEIVERRGGTLDEQKWGLLHDAPESYMTDMITPIKVELINFDKIEGPIMNTIAEKFSLSPTIPKIVKEIDREICRSEMKCLLSGNDDWKNIPGEDFIIEDHPPIVAKRMFLKRYLELFEITNETPETMVPQSQV